jgi:uncharacterized protein YkvS
MENSEHITLFNKDGFIFSQNGSYNYEIKFEMKNNNIILDKIVNFGLIKLVYDLNPDIYLTSSLDKLNENEAIVTLLLKHFFEDLGMTQRYSYMHMKKRQEDNKIIFEGQSILGNKPECIPKEAEILALQNVVCVCEIITPHAINFSFSIFFSNKHRIPPPFVQKMIGVILNKIFKRVKQFIENMQL